MVLQLREGKDIMDWYLAMETSRGTEAQSVSVESTGCEFDPHSRKWNIYLHLHFHFFALVSRQLLNTQYLQNSAESGERIVLTLGSLAYPAVCGIQRETGYYFITKNLYNTQNVLNVCHNSHYKGPMFYNTRAFPKIYKGLIV